MQLHADEPLGFLVLVLIGAVASGINSFAGGGTLVSFPVLTLSFGIPSIKANATLGWDYRGWNAAWTTTYYSSYKQLLSPQSPITHQGGSNPDLTAAQGSFTIPSQVYHDIYASYAFGVTGAESDDRPGKRFLSGVSLQFGIRNVFNKLPPFDVYNLPYFYSTYGDPRLRTYRLAVTIGF